MNHGANAITHHAHACQATSIEDLSNRQTKLLFVCARWQIVRFRCKLEWKQNTAEQNNKHLYERFRFPWTAVWIEDEPEGTFWYVFLRAHPTITIRETSARPFHGSKKKHSRAKIIISIGCLHFIQGLLFCCYGSNQRLVLGHSRTTSQVCFFSRGRDKNPA